MDYGDSVLEEEHKDTEPTYAHSDPTKQPKEKTATDAVYEPPAQQDVQDENSTNGRLKSVVIKPSVEDVREIMRKKPIKLTHKLVTKIVKKRNITLRKPEKTITRSFKYLPAKPIPQETPYTPAPVQPYFDYYNHPYFNASAGYFPSEQPMLPQDYPYNNGFAGGVHYLPLDDLRFSTMPSYAAPRGIDEEMSFRQKAIDFNNAYEKRNSFDIRSRSKNTSRVVDRSPADIVARDRTPERGHGKRHRSRSPPYRQSHSRKENKKPSSSQIKSYKISSKETKKPALTDPTKPSENIEKTFREISPCLDASITCTDSTRRKVTLVKPVDKTEKNTEIESAAKTITSTEQKEEEEKREGSKV